jgi:hypothetical protein
MSLGRAGTFKRPIIPVRILDGRDYSLQKRFGPWHIAFSFAGKVSLIWVYWVGFKIESHYLAPLYDFPCKAIAFTLSLSDATNGFVAII